MDHSLPRTHAYQDVQQRLYAACAAAQRPPDSVTLIAASKAQPPEKIAALFHEHQHRDFGENYTQELLAKAEALKTLDLRWHYIGQLQSNKIKKIVAAAAVIHTAATIEHVQAIAGAARAAGKTPYPIYLAVNAGEAQKSGVSMAEAPRLAAQITAELPEIDLRGIMCIPPAVYQDHSHPDVPELYLQLARLAKGIGAGGLSLGMSGDLKIAIAAGSTCIRIGTALFGARNQAVTAKDTP